MQLFRADSEVPSLHSAAPSVGIGKMVAGPEAPSPRTAVAASAGRGKAVAG